MNFSLTLLEVLGNTGDKSESLADSDPHAHPGWEMSESLLYLESP